MKVILSILFLLIFAPSAFAITYNCKVTRKFEATDETLVYTPQMLEKSQFGVILEFGGNHTNAVMSRCSYSPSAKMVTCDRYIVDRVELYQSPTAKDIWTLKFYHFRNHFDVQLFPNNTFIENNGRGSIASGKCTTK